jgi:hypothetical protein
MSTEQSLFQIISLKNTYFDKTKKLLSLYLLEKILKQGLEDRIKQMRILLL